MLTAIDRLGRQTQFSYGGTGNWNLTAITEPMRTSGNSTSAPYLSLAYDGSGRLASITETGGGSGGRTTSVTVDGSGNLTRITDPDGGYDSYGYDASGRLHTITDRRGNTTTYNYGPTWKLSQVVSPAVPIDNGSGGTTSMTPTVTLSPWQAVGVPLSATATNPAPLLEADTIAAHVQNPNGSISALFPNRWGEAVKTADALGNVTQIQYQGFLPAVVTHPDNSVDSASYNASNGLLLSQRSAGQQSVSYTYGNRNQLQTVSGSGVVSLTNTLDSLGRVIKTQYGTVTGDTTTFTYDAVTKSVASMFRPDTGQVTYQYDTRFGNLVTETDPGSRVTQSYFDAYGRDTAVVAPQHPMVRTQYDVLNRVTAEYNGHATNPIRIAYDAILPVSVRDPMSHVDSTEYDALGRASRHFGYASQTVGTTTRYDLGGRPTSTTNRRGQRINLTYDALDRVLRKSGDSTTTDVFTYSANGLTGTAVNGTDAVRMVTVPSARLDSVQTTMHAPGVTQHTYTVVHYRSASANGTDSTAISSDGAPAQLVTRRYVSDSTNGTLRAIDLGPSIGQGAFGYDAPGRRVSSTWPGGSGGAGSSSGYLRTGTHAYQSYGSLDPSFYVGYRVDSAGRILRDHRHDGSATTYTNRVFGYDALGRYTGTTTLSDAQYPWTCGGSGRFDPNYGEIGCAIDSVPTPAVYGYDDAENRVGGGIHYGVGDQVTSSDGYSYTYDADGNVSTRTQTVTGTVWSYSWSSDNRLLSATQSNGISGATSVSFDYDALGQPVVKRGNAGEAMRVTLFDGGSILADLDAAGNREAEYVYDAGTDRPYAMLTGATVVSAVRYYAEDDLGNVEGQFVDATHPTETVVYSDWGVPSVAGETVNRLTWKGLSYDPDVGLTYVRARWYDPNIGKFVSEDPLGLGGGINPYVFANNDPINGSDPSGMDQCITIDIPPVNVCGGNVCTHYDGYTKEVCISGGGSGGSGSSGGAIGSTGGGGGGGSGPGQPSAQPKTKPAPLSKVSCSASIVSTALSGATDLLWVSGISEAVVAAKAGSRIAVAGAAAATQYAERFTVKEVQGTSQLYYGSRVAGKQATTLARDNGLSILSGGGSAVDFFSGLVPIYGTYKAYQTYKGACGVNGGSR